MSDDPVRHFTNASCWLGSWRNVSLQFWSGHVTMVEIEQASRLTDTLVERLPDGFVSLAVIQTNSLPKLAEAERAQINAINKKLVGRLLANVQIVEGGGFAASGVRAILAGINLFNPNRGRIFEDVTAAARWLEAQPRIALPSAALVDAVGRARKGWARALGGGPSPTM